MTNADDDAQLRRAAEARLLPVLGVGAGGGDDSHKLLHELQVHQIELEMQNSELRQTRAQLEAALASYTELYDFAPVGYFTFDRQGVIRQLNLAGARLLGSERATLIGRHFRQFVAAESQSVFASLLERALESHERETSDIALTNGAFPPGLPYLHIEVVVSGMAESFRAVAVDVSAAKAANDERIRSSEWLGLALSASYAGTWEWNLATNENRWSDQLWTLYGIENHTTRSSYQTWADSIHPDDRPRCEATVSQAVAAGREFTMEWRVNLPGAQQRWLMSRGQPILGADGRPERYIGLIIDITERKLAEETLLASRQRYAALFNAVPYGISLNALPDGRIMDVNPAYCKTVEYTRDELVGRLSSDFDIWVHPEQRGIILERFARERRVRDFEMEYRAKSGRTGWVRLSLEGVEIDDTAYFFTLIEDIGAQKAASEHLRKLSLAVEQSLASIVITDIDGAIEYVNESFQLVTGYSREEVLGRNPRFLHSGKTPQDTYRAMWADLSSGLSWRGEFNNRRKDGSDYVEFAVITPLRQADGKITHYVAVKEDITARKLMVEELDRYRRHLEELVDERTAQLTQAKEQAESANRAKSAFLANMSHEIRTPMNAIVGLTHMLLRRPGKSDDDVDKLKKIGAAADHLLSLINDVLDISKIEASKLVLENREFDIEAVLSHVCSLMVDRVREKGLELVINAEPHLGNVRGDANRLAQALLNYLGNALKFTERGTIILRAKVLEKSLDDVLVRFEVEDSGIGIAPEHLPRLFHIFEQADSSTTRRFGGTGLGLAITRRIAELMGGEAGMENSAGGGCLFWLTARLGLVATHKAGYPIPALNGKRALIIGDSPVARLAQAQMLRLAGLMCDSAASGATALDMLAVAEHDGKPYSLVLIDFMMPDMDGFETLANLRISALQQQPQAWLITASGDPALFDDARHAGFAEVLLKPLTTSVLCDALKRHLAAFTGEPEEQCANVVETPDSDVVTQLRSGYTHVRLLLVEDDLINQMVAQDILGDIGCQVDVASNGQEAVDLAAANSYQLILMDMQMPVMGGLEATRKIRALPQGREVPIIAVSANAFNEDRVACLAAGMNDFITKPVLPDALYATILRWLAGRGTDETNG